MAVDLRSVGLRWLLGIVVIGPAILSPKIATASFTLRYVDHTGIEIAMAWDPVPDATAYVVQRDTAPGFDTGNMVSYTLDPSVTGFGDTGWPLNDRRRFAWRSNVADSPTYHLDPGVSYYYRVVAQTPSGAQISNSIGPCQIADYHSASEIVRGVPGDLWADAVLGKPSFGENSFLKTDPYHVQMGGGVVLDNNTSRPTHVFIADGNHNRVLVLEALGWCAVSQALCSIDADCNSGDSCVLMPGQMAPSFVLGQPSDTDAGACNLDATTQTFPNLLPPSASTLCFMPQYSISVGESVILIQMAVDQGHTLYVPDPYNNRVLMYRDPFDSTNGTAAAEIWGQDSADGRLCNQNGGPPTLSSLCQPNAADIDASGNLWVSDAANSRVLRFPRNATTGQIAKTADIALTGLWYPTSVRVAAGGDVYVLQSSGVAKFAKPPPGTTSTHQDLTYISQDAEFGGPMQMAFDPTHPRRLWVQISTATEAAYNLDTQQAVKRLHSGQFRGIGMSWAGDLFSLDAWDHFGGLFRLGPSQVPASGAPIGDVAFLGYGAVTLDELFSAMAITIVGNQLLISDAFNIHYWNDYHSITDSNDITRPADGMWGEMDALSGGTYYVVRGDEAGRIWVRQWPAQLMIFAGPLTTSATPLKSFTISHYQDASGSIQPLPSGNWVSIGNFTPVGSGDQVWIGDEEHARVLRVVNIDGVERPAEPPYIDIVLGQADITGSACNKGASNPYAFARDTLCREFLPVVDALGNLYVQENATGGIDGGHTRILRWHASSIPGSPSDTLYNLLPDVVYGAVVPTNFTAPPWTSGSGSEYPCRPEDAACPPRAPAFDAWGRMVVGGANPYVGARFGMAYLNPDQNYQPALALGDFVSFPSVSYMDPDGNLYLGDYDWSRVLVYKAPLAAFASTAQSTPRPTATTRPTSAPTLTPTPTRTRPPSPTVGCPAIYPEVVLADSPTNYWRLGEAPGSSVATDETGHNQGTYVQPVTLGAPGAVSADSNTALQCLGTNAGNMSVTGLASTAGAFTIEAWFKADAADQAPRYLLFYGPDVIWGYRSGFVELFDPPGVSCRASSGMALHDTQWHHIAYTYDRSTSNLRGYMDGVMQVNATCTLGTSSTSTHLNVCGLDVSDPNGTLDEVALYQGTALSPARIAAHYQAANCTPATATPITSPTEIGTAEPTATPTPVLCGNGILDISEQCDDGNDASGDLCPAGCSYATSRSLIRGKFAGSTRERRGCQLEWYVAGPIQRDRYGLPSARQICMDGDPGCDFQMDSPGLCEFQVVVCLNNSDPNLPACTPNGIATNVISMIPRPDRTSDPYLRAIFTADLAAAQTAATHLLDPSNPAEGYSHAPPLSAAQQGWCSAPFPVDIPVNLSVTRATKRRVVLAARSTDTTPYPAKTNTSRLRLMCTSLPGQ